MATKLVNQNLQQFGAAVNSASEIGIYGSGATGSPQYTGSVTLIQSLAAWSRGWAAETIANNRPFLEDMNAVDYVFGYQLSYVKQMGLIEYDPLAYYFVNSIVQYSGVVYQCFNDNSGAGILGQLPTNATYWKVFSQVFSPGGVRITGLSHDTRYFASTDGYVTGWASSNSTPLLLYGYDNSSSVPGSGVAIAVSSAFETGGASSIAPISFYVHKGNYYEISTNGNAPLNFGMNFTPVGS